ncbi:MAG: C-GCAxxG-C-C family protein [Tissierellales bacterium]|jgi:C_GCAxxG_C_C family probable redox protein|nr:C-GCAxxG-C-C family protein [Tissierellales bacterium]
MLEQFIEKYRNKDLYDLSCSETIVMAASDAYSLDLSEDFFHAMAPFSGGMYQDEACGALTGGLAIIGVVFTEKRAHDSEILKEINAYFFENFKKRLSCTHCEKLKELHRREDVGCNPVIFEAGEALEETINKFATKTYCKINPSKLQN